MRILALLTLTIRYSKSGNTWTPDKILKTAASDVWWWVEAQCLVVVKQQSCYISLPPDIYTFSLHTYQLIDESHSETFCKPLEWILGVVSSAFGSIFPFHFCPPSPFPFSCRPNRYKNSLTPHASLLQTHSHSTKHDQLWYNYKIHVLL